MNRITRRQLRWLNDEADRRGIGVYKFLCRLFAPATIVVLVEGYPVITTTGHWLEAGDQP